MELKTDIILDSDVFNEIDDQFAIAYMVKNQDRLNIKGITIAPFSPIHNKKVSNESESIDRSYDEAIHTLDLLGALELKNKVYKGSRRFLKDEEDTIESEAVDFIINESKNYNKDNRLTIVAIGAITNIASAINKDESIVDRINLVWLGGSSYDYFINREFNMYQDIAAARVSLLKAKNITILPCQGVVSHFLTTKYELDHFIKGKNKLCDFLYDNVVNWMDKNKSQLPTWSKVIWDVCAIAYLLNDNNRFMIVKQRKLRIPNYDKCTYSDELDKEINYVYEIKRDPLFLDLFNKISI